MNKSLVSLAVMGALTALSSTAMAEDAPAAPAAEAAAPAAPASPWTITTNINFVSDYYFRGISQTWHKPAVQGGVDISHSSGAYAGAWFSNISDNTFGDGQLEVDYYFGYNGTFGDMVKDLGWTVGGYGYYYPGASYKKTTSPADEDYNTFEVNAGLSYKWISAKVSYDLTDWYGANKKTGFKDDTRGSTYVEINAAIPLPVWDLTLIGHVGHENVTSELTAANAGTGEASPDYTDYKIGLSKAFKIAASDGWSAGIYYVGANNDSKNDYWGKNGWGGANVSKLPQNPGSNLADAHFVFTIGRVF